MRGICDLCGKPNKIIVGTSFIKTFPDIIKPFATFLSKSIDNNFSNNVIIKEDLKPF